MAKPVSLCFCGAVLTHKRCGYQLLQNSQLPDPSTITWGQFVKISQQYQMGTETMFRRKAPKSKKRSKPIKATTRPSTESDLIDPLSELEWSREFDLDLEKDRNMVERIAILSAEFGQEFQVLKLTPVARGWSARPKLSGSPIVNVYDRFPRFQEVWMAVEDTWGGGTYGVRARSMPALLLKTYEVPGPAKYPRPPSDPEPEDQTDEFFSKEFWETIEAIVSEHALEQLENNPELQRQFGMAILLKYLGKDAPEELQGSKEPEESLEDQLFREGIEKNPELKRKHVKHLIEKRLGIKLEEEDQARAASSIEDLISQFEEVEKYAKAMGWTREKKGSNDLGELLTTLSRSGQLTKIFSAFKTLVDDFKQRQAGTTDSPPPQTEPGAPES